jgi:hypothetical protein
MKFYKNHIMNGFRYHRYEFESRREHKSETTAILSQLFRFFCLNYY